MQRGTQICLLVHQDMKERHEKETALRAERDVLAKDAADKQAADLVSSNMFIATTNILHATLLSGLSPYMVQLLDWPGPGILSCNCSMACVPAQMQ